jgi:hypothetical protein
MSLFVRGRDFKFFQVINRELIDYIVDTPVIIYKISVSETEENLYGESINKYYSQGVQLPAQIQIEDQDIQTEEFGPTIEQLGTFSFQRERIKIVGFYPEMGDIIQWNDTFWEITSTVENRLAKGQFFYNHSIACRASMVSRDKLNLEEVRPGTE